MVDLFETDLTTVSFSLWNPDLIDFSLSKRSGAIGALDALNLYAASYFTIASRAFESQPIALSRNSTTPWPILWRILWCFQLHLLRPLLLMTVAIGFSISVGQHLPTAFAGVGH